MSNDDVIEILEEGTYYFESSFSHESFKQKNPEDFLIQQLYELDENERDWKFNLGQCVSALGNYSQVRSKVSMTADIRDDGMTIYRTKGRSVKNHLTFLDMTLFLTMLEFSGKAVNTHLKSPIDKSFYIEGKIFMAYRMEDYLVLTNFSNDISYPRTFYVDIFDKKSEAYNLMDSVVGNKEYIGIIIRGTVTDNGEDYSQKSFGFA